MSFRPLHLQSAATPSGGISDGPAAQIRGGALPLRRLLTLWIKAATAIALLCSGLFSPVHALTVELGTPEEVLAVSDTVFVGTVLSATPQWTNAKKTLVATDYEIRMDRVLLLGRSAKFAGRSAGDVVTLSFAGGELDGIKFVVSGLPTFEVGQQAVFLLRDANAEAFSPLTGTNQGLYRFTADKSGKQVASRFSGCGGLSAVRQSFFSDDVDRLQGFTPDEFVTELERALAMAKSRPELKRWIEPKVVPESLKGRVFTGADFPRLGASTSSASSSPKSGASAPVALDPFVPSVPEGVDGVERASAGSEAAPDTASSDSASHVTGDGDNSVRYGWMAEVPDLPMAFNIPPVYYGNALAWGVNFEYALSSWNRYASGVFTKIVNGENSFSKNKRNDFAFASNEDMVDQYNRPWPDDGLGVTITQMILDEIVEADIFLNPVKVWTNDYEIAYAGQANLFRMTATHEAGHAIGRNHAFEENHQGVRNSVMNYPSGHFFAQSRYPFMDDAESVRGAYPSRRVELKDLAVYLFRTNGVGNQNTGSIPMIEAAYQKVVPAGAAFSVNGFTIENAGTIEAAPSLQFYFAPARFSFAGARSLGSQAYVPLPRYNQLFPSFTGTVPLDTPPGVYFLGANLNSSDDNNQNRSGWAKAAVTVTAPPTISVSPNVLNRTIVQGETAGPQVFSVRNTGTGTLVYNITDNADWISCTPLFGNSTGEWDAITVNYATALLPPGNHTAFIRANSEGAINKSQPVGMTVVVSPANDHFANRYDALVKGNGSNVNATAQPGEPQHRPGIPPGKSVWWKYTPDVSGKLILTTTGSNFDTVLAVYRGASFGSMTQLGSNDDSDGITSRITGIPVVAGTEYQFAVDGHRSSEGIYASGNVVLVGSFQPDAVKPIVQNTFSDSDGWSPTGDNTLTYAASHNRESGALTTTFLSRAANRNIGWFENQAAGDPTGSHLKYSEIAPSELVRAKFHVYATGQSSPGERRQIPNLRMRISSRFAFSSLLEILHHSSDVGAAGFTRDLAPSTVAEKPSVYRVDLNPPMLPYLQGNTSEGLQRMFEAYSTSGEPHTNGSLALAESSIGVYPAPDLDSTHPAVLIKTYSTEADFARMYYDLRQYERGSLALKAANINGNNSGGSADGASWTGVPEGEITAIANEHDMPGVTLSTAGTSDALLATAAVDWLNGNAEDGNHTLRARLEESTQYLVRFYATSNGPSASNAMLRFRARTAKFNMSQRLEVGGAWNLSTLDPSTGMASKDPSLVSHILAQQYLPGRGGWMNGNPDGGVYDVLMVSPLSKDIRPDTTGTIEQRMPGLATEDGPGEGLASRTMPSRRDIYPGMDIIDSLSGGAQLMGTEDPEEKGTVRINRIEIRKFDQVAD